MPNNSSARLPAESKASQRAHRQQDAPFVGAVMQTSGMPIAAVAVDVALPHLDRTFDYRVPEELRSVIAVGQRVRVRFAGRIVTGCVLGLHDDTTRATADIRAIVSPTVVLPTAMARLVRAVADRYASTFADCLRFAVPPRHGRSEVSALQESEPLRHDGRELSGPLAQLRPLTAFLARSRNAEAVAACLELPAAVDMAPAIADLAAAALLGGSVIVVAPDATDVERIRAALETRGLAPIVMQAGSGPAARQRAFTLAARAERAVVLGTRSSVFAPLAGLGTTILVSDGDDGLVEPHTPGWHAREVALLRNTTQGWSSLFVARHRSVEMQSLVAGGAVKALAWPVEEWRAQSVRVEVVPERLDDADPMLRRLRIPPSVFRAMRESLTAGPVALLVPQRGYVTSVRCGGCREVARCARCTGPIAIAAPGAAPRCTICGALGWQCPWCQATSVRFSSIGSERTREELGRAFPNLPVRVVDADHPLAVVPQSPQVLLITPGAEPSGRLGLVVVLDADMVLARQDLAAASEAVRRWSDAAAMVDTGGRMLIVGTSTAPAVQALVRGDPVGFAARELEERAAADLPPATHVALVLAPAGSAVASEIVEAIPGSTLRGPVGVGEEQRWIVAHAELEPLVLGVRVTLARRSASKTLVGVTVRIDPLELSTAGRA